MTNLNQKHINVINLSKNDLNDKVLLFKKELFNLRVQQTIGELKNTSRFSIVKKEIARIKTELAKRKLGD